MMHLFVKSPPSKSVTEIVVTVHYPWFTWALIAIALICVIGTFVSMIRDGWSRPTVEGEVGRAHADAAQRVQDTFERAKEAMNNMADKTPWGDW